MKKVRLGKTDLMVTKTAFGALPIQRISVDDAVKLVRRAYEGGINYFDTANMYSDSEEKIGEALHDVRQNIVISTKSGGKDKATVQAHIENSLRMLKTDYIDLYQVHNPNMAQLEQVLAQGGALEALLEAKEQGKIGHIGLTAHSVEVFEKALELPWVETIMFPYNIVETQGEALIKKCAEKNIGFVDMKPLAGGAIEDAALAMRFLVSNPDVTVVIPGMADPKEVEVNLSAAENTAPLSADELEKVAEVRQTLGTQFCRRCNYCAPCTVGINIPSVFLFQGYLDRYGLADWAKDRYGAMAVKASACVQCGACEPRCPYGLPIRQMLKEAAAKFGV